MRLVLRNLSSTSMSAGAIPGVRRGLGGMGARKIVEVEDLLAEALETDSA